MSTDKPSNEVQVDVHHMPNTSQRPHTGTQNENGNSLPTVDPCSNGQFQQLQNVLEQGFASMASNISSKINDALKSFSERFEMDEDELLQSDPEDGELAEAVEEEPARSNNGDLERQNAREHDHRLSGTNVQRMIERVKGTDTSKQTKEPSVLDGIRADLKSEETGRKVNDDLAEIVNGLLQKGLPEDGIQEKLPKYPSPENCQSLCKVKVNQLIWDNLSPNTRSQDLRFQKVQTAMVRSMAAIIRATDSVLEHVTNFPKGKEVVEQLTDAIALCTHANSELNTRRKELIKPDLHDDYKHLCSPSLPSSSLLFGDGLSKQVKDLTEVNKVGRKMTRQATRPYSRGRSSNFRRQGQYKARPFLGERQMAYSAAPPYRFKKKQQRPKYKAQQA